MDAVLSPELTALAISYSERLAKKIKGWGGDLLLALKKELGFQTKAYHYDYAISLIANYACLKTFFIRNESVPLYDFYVPAKIRTANGKVINSASFDDLDGVSRCTVVTGVGGAGKTIFMRHVLLSCLSKSEKIPVFIELRDMTGGGSDLHDFVLENLKSNGLNINRSFYDRLVKEGSIVYILDGFDEIRHEARKSVERQISKLSKTTNCSVLVSSRPDVRFQSWPEF